MLFRFLVLIVLLTAAPLLAADSPRFVFDDGNIAVWQETERGFKIELTDLGRRELHALTKANVKKHVSFFIKTMLYSTAAVSVPLDTGKAEFTVTPEQRDAIRSLLPRQRERFGPFQAFD